MYRGVGSLYKCLYQVSGLVLPYDPPSPVYFKYTTDINIYTCFWSENRSSWLPRMLLYVRMFGEMAYCSSKYYQTSLFTRWPFLCRVCRTSGFFIAQVGQQQQEVLRINRSGMITKGEILYCYVGPPTKWYSFVQYRSWLTLNTHTTVRPSEYTIAAFDAKGTTLEKCLTGALFRARCFPGHRREYNTMQSCAMILVFAATTAKRFLLTQRDKLSFYKGLI